MSLNGALNNAFGGLRANARSAALVSTNLANASTEGYGRRVLALSPDTIGTYGGVRIDGVTRLSDPIVIADRRLSDAALGDGNMMASFANRLETAVGAPDDAGSLQSMVTLFENALITAAANPASTQRLESVAVAAERLADTLNRLSADIQEERMAADKRIALDVDRLNDAVVQVDQLNGDIAKALARKSDASSLLDERQRVIDGISEIVPLRVVPRADGEVALFTTQGGVLLDGRPTALEFTPTNAIGPAQTFAGGTLSGLTVNGRDTDMRFFDGGTLAANFRIRDVDATEAQAQLDAIARDLVERLGPGGPDATLLPGDPGFFTDSGLAFLPANEVGLAGRVALNALIAPGSPETWRIRDGLAAAAQGDAGDARLILGVSEALEARNVPSSAALSPVGRSFATQISEFAAARSAYRVRMEDMQAYSSAQNTALKELELSKGVNSDLELQILLQIEQNYAANAQVMTAVDEMLQRLLAI